MRLSLFIGGTYVPASFVCLRRDANRSDWNEDISYSQAGEDTYKLKVGRDYEEKYD
ncbi:hypothetical protein FAM21834_01558 [Lentilactobacillus parabuchneri]|uniref:Uncharacterized protein n=2 Tax=Lentilactobacillus parabuchneri TaxID=152331 RepID=A0A1X1FE84_9LACO|nr:hypothetical protein FAM21834_01558 [Lentilactobacillus parabuchneri]ORN28531.1 hypothetical protein FAM23169_01443 [Lentilactobacillus parabuchneri]